MIQGADGAWYPDAQSAAAGSAAVAQGILQAGNASTYAPDNSSTIFGNSPVPSTNTTPTIGPTIPTVMQGIDAILQGILHPIDTLTGKNTAAMNKDVQSGTGPASSIASGLSFISDIPRVATTLLGLILLIAGIFALSKGPAVNIVSGAVKNSLTS